MLHQLKRHPIPIRAYFGHCLVLAYAFPAGLLDPLLPPGLSLDAHNGHGILAIAMVQTRRLRPAFLPAALGQDFFLTGYRIFAKYRTPAGRTLRGLRILRSDADRRLMVLGGNLLTHYNYRRCSASIEHSGSSLGIVIRTPGREADVDVRAELDTPAVLPEGSPFATLQEARRFAGPLPFTLDYEQETHSIIRIKGVREHWEPRPVRATVHHATFLQAPMFRGHRPALASAFYTAGVEYLWERGIREPLGEPAHDHRHAPHRPLPVPGSVSDLLV